MRRPGGQPTAHLEGGSVSAGQGWGVNELMPIIVFPAARRKAKGKGKGASCRRRQPSATPPVRQGHGPPGHGASGPRAARSLASHRRPEWDNRGEGFGSKVWESVAGSDTLARLPKIDDGAPGPGQMRLWCFPGLRDRRSHDTQRPSWQAGLPWALQKGTGLPERYCFHPSSHCGLITCWPGPLLMKGSCRTWSWWRIGEGLDLMGAQKGRRAIGPKTLQALPSALLFVLMLWHELTAVSHHVHHHSATGANAQWSWLPTVGSILR